MMKRTVLDKEIEDNEGRDHFQKGKWHPLMTLCLLALPSQRTFHPNEHYESFHYV